MDQVLAGVGVIKKRELGIPLHSTEEGNRGKKKQHH